MSLEELYTGRPRGTMFACTSIALVRIIMMIVYILFGFIVFYSYKVSKSSRKVFVTNFALFLQFIVEVIAAYDSASFGSPSTIYSFAIGIPVTIIELFLCNIALKHKKDKLAFSIFVIGSIIAMILLRLTEISAYTKERIIRF